MESFFKGELMNTLDEDKIVEDFFSLEGGMH